MVEHREADLDELFTQLEGDVASVCDPPGAALAIAVVRRRRRTTVCVVLATVALIAGGVATDAQLRHDAPVQTMHRGLPPPGPLSAARLSAATDGWLPHLTPGVLLVPALQHKSLRGLPCFSPEQSLLADPASATRRFATTEFTVVLAVVRTFPHPDAHALDTQLVNGLAPCRTLPETAVAYPGGAVVDYASQFRPGRDLHVWVARRGDLVALLVVGAAGNPPEYHTVGRVSDLLVAALEDHAADSP